MIALTAMCMGGTIFCFTSPLFAQTSKTTWQDGLRLIDSPSPADVVAAASLLDQALQAKRVPAAFVPTATTALAICQLRQGESAKASQTLKLIHSQYSPAQLEKVRGTLLRATFIAALNDGDAATAENAYKDLVRLVVVETSDSLDLRAAAHTIGVAGGMLDNDRAQSPIDARVMAIGREQMQISKLHGVATGYQSAYEQASERAAALLANFQLIEQQGLESFASTHAARTSAMKERLEQLQSQKQLTNEVVRNTREQIDQNTLDVRNLAKDIAAINAKLRQATPGHPGPKRPAPPPPPSRRSLLVDEFETRTEFEYIFQNGQQIRTPVTRTVRRPQYEIDRERDRIYDRIMDDYDRAQQDYRRYESTYSQSLASWTDTDQRRRNELNEDKAEAEAKRSQLIAANKEIDAEKKDSAKELRLKRTEQEQEEFELQMQDIALTAWRTGQLHLAFRPPNFELVQWLQERVLLQTHARTAP
ncbi:MAG: hypothetical protein IT423_02665 [Pirellulaceae bacterium]|nr:hypothetical protein [Pirellulaceae bacterium]